jgi:hypothetical protein
LQTTTPFSTPTQTPLRRVATRLLAILLFAAPLSGQSQEADDLGPDKWPKTVQEAVTIAIQRLSPESRAKLRAMKEGDLILLHHGYGTGLRNYLGLWRGNSELIKSACGHPCHPDDASMVIIEATWKQLQK